MQNNSLHRGDVVLVNLKGAEEDETKNGRDGEGNHSKPRPCIVVQNNGGHRSGQTTIVVPLTDGERIHKSLPVLVYLTAEEKGGGKGSYAHCEQIRTIDTACRVLKFLGHVQPAAMERIDRALAISLGLLAA